MRHLVVATPTQIVIADADAPLEEPTVSAKEELLDLADYFANIDKLANEKVQQELAAFKEEKKLADLAAIEEPLARPSICV